MVEVLLDHLCVLCLKVSVVVFWHCRLELVDTRNFCLDDDSKSVTPVIHFFWMWVVRQADEVAAKFLDYRELLSVVSVIQSICFVCKVIMHADASQLVWLSIQQEAGVCLSIDCLVDDI